MPVAVVVNPGTTGIPACLRSRLDQSGALCDIGEGSIAVVMIKRVLPIVGDEQIVITIVVIVADAARLSPTGAHFQARTLGDIGERAVTVVLEQTTMRLLTFGKSFQAPSIHHKNVQPAIVVVIVEGEAAASGFQQVLVLAHATEDGFNVQAGTLDDIHEADTQRGAFDRGFRTGGRRSGLGVVAALDRTNLFFLWGLLLLWSG